MRVKRYFAQQVRQKKFMRILLNSVGAFIMVASTLLLSPGDARACASCGCTLSSDWENEQLSCTPGLKMDLRWDFIDQDQLRSGTKTIDPVTASKLPDPQTGGTEEIEKYTVNNYYTLGIDYSTGSDWGVNIQVPWINRNHSTLGTASDGYHPGAGRRAVQLTYFKYWRYKGIGSLPGFVTKAQRWLFFLVSSCRPAVTRIPGRRLTRPLQARSLLIVVFNPGQALPMS